MTENQNWNDIQAALADKWNPDQIRWRLQTKPANPAEPKGLAVAYLNPRDIQDRLDTILGIEGWAWDWQPIIIEGGKVIAAKGTITIAGISKSDVGTSRIDEEEATKSAVTDALKRTAVLWGIGREIYKLPMQWVKARQQGKNWTIEPEELKRLAKMKIA
jgi:hypothetical protein